MRLAPVAIYFHGSASDAMSAAYRQSLTTHQGMEAAECCRLLAHILVTAMHHPAPDALERKRAVLQDGLAAFQSPVYSVSCLAAGEAEKQHPSNVAAGDGEYSVLGRLKVRE